MEYSSGAEGISQAMGVRTLLRQGHRLVASRQSLVRIAKEPQRPGAHTVALHTSVFPKEGRVGTVLLGVVERSALCKVRVRSGDRAQPEQRISQVNMRR